MLWPRRRAMKALTTVPGFLMLAGSKLPAREAQERLSLCCGTRGRQTENPPEALPVPHPQRESNETSRRARCLAAGVVDANCSVDCRTAGEYDQEPMPVGKINIGARLRQLSPRATWFPWLFSAFLHQSAAQSPLLAHGRPSRRTARNTITLGVHRQGSTAAHPQGNTFSLCQTQTGKHGDATGATMLRTSAISLIPSSSR